MAALLKWYMQKGMNVKFSKTKLLNWVGQMDDTRISLSNILKETRKRTKELFWKWDFETWCQTIENSHNPISRISSSFHIKVHCSRNMDKYINKRICSRYHMQMPCSLHYYQLISSPTPSANYCMAEYLIESSISVHKLPKSRCKICIIGCASRIILPAFCCHKRQ